MISIRKFFLVVYSINNIKPLSIILSSWSSLPVLLRNSANVLQYSVMFCTTNCFSEKRQKYSRKISLCILYYTLFIVKRVFMSSMSKLFVGTLWFFISRWKAACISKWRCWQYWTCNSIREWRKLEWGWYIWMWYMKNSSSISYPTTSHNSISSLN